MPSLLVNNENSFKNLGTFTYLSLQPTFDSQQNVKRPKIELHIKYNDGSCG